MTANLKAPARNAGIDCLRGLAIVLVIVHHLALPFRLPLRPSLLGEWLPKRLLSAISFNGYEAVFVFFVISGFLITSRIAARDGDIGRVDLRRFYMARALRILPLLCVVLAVLTVLALADVPGFAPEPGQQSVGGLLGSALTFTFNWYEGRTGWAPAGWDVLWSLSIEEIFYMVYPILCVMLPRRALVGLLFLLALALVPLHAQPPILRRGLRWLAAMGRMSYELYLSHMFIVLATVTAYRALLGSQQAWTFAVYLPVLACCYALARQLERGAARILPSR